MRGTGSGIDHAMNDPFIVAIIENDEGGHDDLIFSIPGLTGTETFDTYYFALAIESRENAENVRGAVAELLQFWIDKIDETKNGETIHLPIDFSDQYTGCLRIKNESDQMTLTYGSSMREGWAVNPLNPEKYYKAINDFRPSSDKQLVWSKSFFISAVNSQVQRLKEQ